MADTVLSREDARMRGLTRYFTGEPCKRGHLADRLVSNRGCVVCAQERSDPEKAKARQRKWYAAHVEEQRERARLYRAADPERARRIGRETKRRHGAKHSRKYYASHREERCEASRKRRALAPDLVRLYNRRYYEADPDHARSRAKRWRTENPGKVSEQWRNRRAKKRGAVGWHTKAEIEALLSRQKCRCAGCNASLRDGYHVDHIVPLARDGTNWISNIQLLCQTCNLRKGAKDPIVWARQNGRLL